MPTHAGTRAIRLQQLLRIAKAVNSTLDLESVLQTIVDTVCDLTTWKMACIAIVDEGTQEVIFVAQRGFHDQGGRPARWPITESLTPQATAAGRTIVVSDTLKLDDYPAVKSNSRKTGYRSVLISPLLHVTPVAALWLCRERPSVFTEDDIAFAEAVADQAAVAIRNATLYHREKERSRDLSHVNETLAVLLQMIIEDRNPSELLSAVAAFLRNPLWFEDPFGRRLPDDLGPPTATLSHGGGPIQWVHEGRTALAVPVIAGGDHYGWLLSWEANHAFNEFDLNAVQQAALAFSLTFLRDRVRHEVESQVRTDLFVSLMSCEQAESNSELRRRGHALRIDLPLPARVCLLDVRIRAGEALERRRRLGDALRIAAARIPGRLVALQDECVAMLLGPSEVTRAEAILPEIARHVRGSQPILAVGDVAERAQRYLDSLRSAQKVLRVARFLGLEASVMRSEDVGIYGLLFDEARSEELEAFRQRVLDKLLQSDNKGLLWETLECLWTQNFNLEATARSLGIHISTLRYRLDRIRAAAGLDWADPALRLQLEIAVVVERWRRTGAGAGAPQP